MAALELTRHGSVAVLTMNRPEARNALNAQMRAEFATLLPDIRDDDSISSVVLTGAGGHFCAGGDIKGITEAASVNDVFEGRTRILDMHRWFDELVDLEKPVIAAVEGSAFGAGLSFALACDFVFSAPDAKYCAVFARIGYTPDLGGMYLLPRAVGLANAKMLAFSAKVLDAKLALGMGLIQRVVDEGSVLEDAIEFAQRFENAPHGAIGIMKSVMNRAFESDRGTVYRQEAMAQAMCRESAFLKEAARRFVEKEPPLYQWNEK